MPFRTTKKDIAYSCLTLFVLRRILNQESSKKILDVIDLSVKLQTVHSKTLTLTYDFGEHTAPPELHHCIMDPGRTFKFSMIWNLGFIIYYRLTVSE